MDITKFNINEYYDEISTNIMNCEFIALDAEFSGLATNENYKNSLFDSGGERYTKIRKRTDGIIATQVGLSTFHFDREKNSYKAATYTFHLCPQSIGSLNQYCTFQAAALNFLTDNEFDFNKTMYEGIPYLNAFEEEYLKKDLQNETLEAFIDLNESDKIKNSNILVKEWMKSSKEDSTLTLPGNIVTCYLIAKYIRNDFPSLDVSFEGYKVHIAKNPSKNILTKDIISKNDDRKLIEYSLGFSRIVKVLRDANKPLVLHNALIDLLIFTNQFIEPLPTRYNSFKNTVHDTFPYIFDTKLIANEMKFFVKKDQFSDSTSLEKLYSFFTDTKGKHLALCSPIITMLEQFDCTPHFHQAGWDSFCTGYCFIRLCHWSASKKFGCERQYTSTEHISSMQEYCNKINLSRAAQFYMNVNADDPPNHILYLFVETLKTEKINVHNIVHILSQYGSIDIKTYGKKCALIAVPNQNCAKRILQEFKQNNDWKVAKYNSLKHSRVARIALWSGVLVSSGCLLTLIVHKMIL